CVTRRSTRATPLLPQMTSSSATNSAARLVGLSRRIRPSIFVGYQGTTTRQTPLDATACSLRFNAVGCLLLLHQPGERLPFRGGGAKHRGPEWKADIRAESGCRRDFETASSKL